jgi:predicted secreted hydrolase
MRSRIGAFVLALLLPAANAQYQTALPGYRYQFPRDHFNHPGFQTEWWYYTGNVQSADGRPFGFELTFFRQAVRRDPAKSNPWDIGDLYLAHLALSDLKGHRFYHSERTNRAGPGIAGIREAGGRIWNGNWQIQWQGDTQNLQAIDERFELHLTMRSTKPAVIHGENGVSQKAEGAGRASHYISLTHLLTTGQIELSGEKFEVTGLAWMDHEFFTHQLEAEQVGWDWLSLQLDDNTELMLFHIRRKDGSIDPFSSGTFVDTQGATTHLTSSDFVLEPAGERWTSDKTHATYPIEWRLAIPKMNLQLKAKTWLASQELSADSRLSPNYWEGAIFLQGHKAERGLAGKGYLEMTGYDQPFRMGE